MVDFILKRSGSRGHPCTKKPHGWDFVWSRASSAGTRNGGRDVTMCHQVFQFQIGTLIRAISEHFLVFIGVLWKRRVFWKKSAPRVSAHGTSTKCETNRELFWSDFLTRHLTHIRQRESRSKGLKSSKSGIKRELFWLHFFDQTGFDPIWVVFYRAFGHVFIAVSISSNIYVVTKCVKKSGHGELFW